MSQPKATMAAARIKMAVCHGFGITGSALLRATSAYNRKSKIENLK